MAAAAQFTNAIVAAISAQRLKYDGDRSGLIDLGELFSGVKAGFQWPKQQRRTDPLAHS